jgi:hypothetical protein
MLDDEVLRVDLVNEVEDLAHKSAFALNIVFKLACQPQPFVRLSRIAVARRSQQTQAIILKFLDCIIFIFFEIHVSYTPRGFVPIKVLCHNVNFFRPYQFHPSSPKNSFPCSAHGAAWSSKQMLRRCNAAILNKAAAR